MTASAPSGTQPLRSVEEHQATVLAAVRLVPAERRRLDEARGLTLREPVVAALDIPLFDNSAMDGFAVRCADVAAASPTHPVNLRVIADVPAGSAADPELHPGQAARIMTGAPLPSQADTVVPWEDTVDGLAGSLEAASVVRPPRGRGAHVRRRGEDVRAGQTLLPSGTALGAFSAAAAASAGVTSVVVSRRPRVAVVSTGDELVPAGSALRRGQIPDSNGILMAGMVAEAACEVVARVSVDDEGARLRAVLDDVADDVDAVVFTGGVSAGAYEVVRAQLAAAMTFTKVAMQPGKPQGFGVLPRGDGTEGPLLFGLPGNPVSAAVSFEVFVRPALLRMQGRSEVFRPTLTLPAASGWKTPPGRRQYLPAVVTRDDDGTWTAGPASAGGSGSHLSGGLGRAHAWAVVPAEVDEVSAGDPIDVMLLEGWPA